ncbi:hypothetical protein MUK42_19100 [Musa troglodytarum]|uniref:Uncharacterized protein n=1 Tax=Musa troglodytarum TaxID=320322 RepID=A0A9E7FZ94_9LILI|nr:hypothetical protein MUK42_19100 [Musa troglodytarum]
MIDDSPPPRIDYKNERQGVFASNSHQHTLGKVWDPTLLAYENYVGRSVLPRVAVDDEGTDESAPRGKRRGDAVGRELEEGEGRRRLLTTPTSKWMMPDALSSRLMARTGNQRKRSWADTPERAAIWPGEMVPARVAL